ncbi:hypothetical protein [Planktosalinus lacus]|uniref:Uncharacterized protein n=1 Tax=Planktosalinus lacus TaxID=1526573 RepID=A0A8J2V8M6_9FLAO|nr:hypothetical protein [Planktosalinus lacus]GGD85920.1 hypothetical protein GCM10011312_07420 [Planktosalinus lacus]
MNDLKAPLGFTNAYFQLLPYFNTENETFEYLNNYCLVAFRSVLYKSYYDFKEKNFNAGKYEHLSGGVQKLARILEKNKPVESLTHLNSVERLKIILGESDEVCFIITENNILSTTEIYKLFIDKIFLTSFSKN